MHKGMTAVATIAVVLAGCRTAEVETGPGVPGAQPAPPTADAIPAGTDLEAQLNQTLSTDRSRVGDRFTATVTRPLIAMNGQTVVPQGAVVTGTVTGVDASDNIGEQAAIRLNFERLSFGGQSYPFSADIVDTQVELERDDQQLLERAGIGAAAGAVLGVIIGGGLADLLIGGALGAGAGTILSLGLGHVDASLPAGTDMTLQTTQHVTLY